MKTEQDIIAYYAPKPRGAAGCDFTHDGGIVIFRDLTLSVNSLFVSDVRWCGLRRGFSNSGPCSFEIEDVGSKPDSMAEILPQLKKCRLATMHRRWCLAIGRLLVPLAQTGDADAFRLNFVQPQPRVGFPSTATTGDAWSDRV
jgi:hypothetical protein